MNAASTAQKSRRLFLTRALVLAAAILALPVLYGFWWWSGEREPDYPRVSPPPVPEQNAFDFYIAAGISVQGLDELENADADDTDLRREFLSRNEEAEQLISQAHEMEYGFPSGPKTADLSYPADLRKVHQFLLTGLEVAVKDGDWETVVRIAEQLLRFGRVVSEDGTLIASLTGTASLNRVNETLYRSLPQRDQDEIARITKVLEKHEPVAGRSFRRALNAERYFIEHDEGDFMPGNWRIMIAKMAEEESPFTMELEEFNFAAKLRILWRAAWLHKGRVARATADFFEAAEEVADLPFPQRLSKKSD